MTFEEYVIEEINYQELYLEDIDFDDSSINYYYDIEYTTQE